MKLVRDAIAAGIFNDLGSGSNIDLCVITKDKVEFLRPYDEANLKGERYVFNPFAPWEIFHAFLSSADFFQNKIMNNSFRNTIWVSNRLDPDQAGRFVSPDLGPNYYQELSADDTRR